MVSVEVHTVSAAPPGAGLELLARTDETGSDPSVGLRARLGSHGWCLEGPDAPTGPGQMRELVTALVSSCRHRAPGPIQWWAEPAGSESDAAATAAGLAFDRDLLQLRIALPADPPQLLALRAFRPGEDDDAWLEVNNAAFHWHQDQSDWTDADLRSHMTQPWFDPGGFLVHEEGGELVGFCWTKVHVDEDPPLGEIFVIAVAPHAHGRGLGRALTLAGLDHLARQGLETGMLYVEGDNRPALGLYRELGFGEHHRRRRYTG